MPDIVTVSDTTFRGLKIPGGWNANVPAISFSVSDSRFSEVVGFYRRHGARERSERMALDACRSLFVGSWRTKLKLFTGGWAEKYVESFGDLDGFDPEKLQRFFVPGRTLWLNRGNFEIRRELGRMRKNA